MEQGRQGQLLDEQVNDATSKVRLLNGELAFNESLGRILERVQAIQRTLDLVQETLLASKLLEAVDFLRQVEEELNSVPVPRGTRVAGVLGTKIADLRNDTVKQLIDCWKAYVRVDSTRSSIKISSSLNGRSPAVSTSDPKLNISQTLQQQVASKRW